MKKHLSLSQRIHNAGLSQEAENVKARHQYLHARCDGATEYDQLWVHTDDCGWGHFFGCMVGFDQVWHGNITDYEIMGMKNFMEKVDKYPEIAGPIIILIGMSLAGSAVQNCSSNWWLAILALAIVVIANIWGKGMIKIIPILLGVAISYAVALILNAFGVTNPDGSALVDLSNIAVSTVTDVVNIPDFFIAKFDVTSILVMAPIAIAAMMEHIGDMSAISATVGEDFISDPGSRPFIWQC